MNCNIILIQLACRNPSLAHLGILANSPQFACESNEYTLTYNDNNFINIMHAMVVIDFGHFKNNSIKDIIFVELLKGCDLQL